MKYAALATLMTICCLLNGCVVGRNGTQHHLIIGFGIVSINNTNKNIATIVKSQALGLTLSSLPGLRLGIGYANTSVIQIKTNANMVIEVDQAPGKPLTVTVPK